MLSYFPKIISNKGIVLYVVSLTVVSLAFSAYSMNFTWMVLGLLEVSVFFLFSEKFTARWQSIPVGSFEKNLFISALSLRVVWVVFSYFFYLSQTGQPFEFGAADALAYHEDAKWLAGQNWQTAWHYLYKNRVGVSDSGYVTYLTLLYKIMGPNVFVARIVKACLSAFMCVLLYRLAQRSIGEEVGRLAGIFAMLMPNLIIYCGMHVKEAEMLFLIVAFLERADYVLRSKKYNVWNIVLPLLLAGSLFLFRTVLGVVTLFSFMTALVFSPDREVGKVRKLVLAVWVATAILVLAGGTIASEIEGYWNNRGVNQEVKRMEQTIRGNQWAKYATGTVMAPMMFVLPFSTMVDTGQENQMVLHGGNYVRNFMGIFAFIALISVIFVKKNWRSFSLVGSFVISYLLVVSLSAFANSERFLLPGLPCLIIFWAYGVSILNAKSFKFVRYWYIIVPIMEIAWAYFKIGSRGLLG